MSDGMQEVIHSVPRFGAVIALFPVCYKAFAWVEDRLSSVVKQDITVWLKSAGDFASVHTLSFNMLRFHSELFGERQFTIKCAFRTGLFCFISFALVFGPEIITYMLYIPNIPVVFEGLKIHDNAVTLILEMLLALYILVIFPLDFLGVGATRMLSSLAGDSVSIKK